MRFEINGRVYWQGGGGTISEDELLAMDNITVRCLAKGNLETMGTQRFRISPRLQMKVHTKIKNNGNIYLIGDFYGKGMTKRPEYLVYKCEEHEGGISYVKEET